MDNSLRFECFRYLVSIYFRIILQGTLPQMTRSKANFYIVTQTLQDVIESSRVSLAKLARDGDLSKETLSKALKGRRITLAKANGILHGIKVNHPDLELDFYQAFSEAGEY